MQFYNTLVRRKEQFVPRQKGKVFMYLCGITAYDYCHIGHARAAVIFDVLVRFLRYSGYEVIFVRNFTDVDDKIINRAREENLSAEEIARKYIDAFNEDMERLNVKPADFEPKATEHLADMQLLIQKLLEKGYAYVTPSGDVYFHVRSFPDYGALSGRDIQELKAGARIEPDEDKKDPLDFALWKKARPDEPSWSSPWGAGRPGWHIECSAMSARYLGLPLDIHAGGQDLVFPHHENERAQSIAASGQEFARYWLHNGFVRVKSEKMSKSLGNFITIRDILQDYLPEVLRFFLLTQHYRSPLDFDWDRLQESEKNLKKIYQTKQLLNNALERKKWINAAFPEEIKEELNFITNEWKSSLEDDLNTAAALGHVLNLVRLANRILEQKDLRQNKEAKEILSIIKSNLQELSTIMGLFEEESTSFLTRLRDIKARRKKIDIQEVESLLEQRREARRSKDFERADAIREQLLQKGVEVQDTPAGTIWDVE